MEIKYDKDGAPLTCSVCGAEIVGEHTDIVNGSIYQCDNGHMVKGKE